MQRQHPAPSSRPPRFHEHLLPDPRTAGHSIAGASQTVQEGRVRSGLTKYPKTGGTHGSTRKRTWVVYKPCPVRWTGAVCRVDICQGADLEGRVRGVSNISPQENLSSLERYSRMVHMHNWWWPEEEGLRQHRILQVRVGRRLHRPPACPTRTLSLSTAAMDLGEGDESPKRLLSLGNALSVGPSGRA